MVCGYGRIGRVLCNFIKEDTKNIVVIEQDETQADVLEKDKLHYLIGDALDEELLTKAGIQSAGFLVAALATDAANVFLVLTARQLNPDIYIMAQIGRASCRERV